MAGKSKTAYICNQCGYESPRWYGKCPGCGGWNSMEESVVQPAIKSAGALSSPGRVAAPVQLGQISTDDEPRYNTGLGELDRVLGGGLVKGSVVLLGGAPGIGKSTLLLQICAYLGRSLRVLYISGEESVRQIKLRADRLGVDTPNLFLLALTDVESIIHTVMQQKPDVVMIDSIQTMTLQGLTSSAGSVVQVRESTNALLKCAKSEGLPFFIVGHVNKDGAIAGPKVLEHIVDTVLYFEGDRNLTYRILRAVKNRYGSTNEIGVFQMEDRGLVQVENPSQMLLSGRPEGVSGTSIACIMEGSRPILAEVQALAAKSSFAAPRRMASGIDYNRLALLIAVLEKRGGFFLGNLDVYVNVVGGLRVEDPAVDLPVLLSLYSNIRDIEMDPKIAAFGEVGLGGEIRSGPQTDLRVGELQRLGFEKCILPEQALHKLSGSYDIELIGVRGIRQAFDAIR